jgi:hypothetical protein
MSKTLCDLKNTFNALGNELDGFIENYVEIRNILYNDVSDVSDGSKNIMLRYVELERNHGRLKQERDELELDRDNILIDCTQLKRDYELLLADHDELKRDYDHLMAECAALVRD